MYVHPPGPWENTRGAILWIARNERVSRSQLRCPARSRRPLEQKCRGNLRTSSFACPGSPAALAFCCAGDWKKTHPFLHPCGALSTVPELIESLGQFSFTDSTFTVGAATKQNVFERVSPSLHPQQTLPGGVCQEPNGRFDVNKAMKNDALSTLQKF